MRHLSREKDREIRVLGTLLVGGLLAGFAAILSFFAGVIYRAVHAEFSDLRRGLQARFRGH